VERVGYPGGADFTEAKVQLPISSFPSPALNLQGRLYLVDPIARALPVGPLSGSLADDLQSDPLGPTCTKRDGQLKGAGVCGAMSGRHLI
jgi:hypothetical protein